MKRRDFLKASAAFAGAAATGSFSCIEIAGAAPIEPPVVDKLTVNILVDSTHNLFLKPITVNRVSVAPPRPSSSYSNERLYDAQMMGFNYRNNEMSDAFCRSFLRRYDSLQALRRRNVEYLNVELSKIKACALRRSPTGTCTRGTSTRCASTRRSWGSAQFT